MSTSFHVSREESRIYISSFFLFSQLNVWTVDWIWEKIVCQLQTRKPLKLFNQIINECRKDKILMQTTLICNACRRFLIKLENFSWWNELEKFSISTPIMWKIKFCFIIRNLNICCISFCEGHIDIIIFITVQLHWLQMHLSIIIG